MTPNPQEPAATEPAPTVQSMDPAQGAVEAAATTENAAIEADANEPISALEQAERADGPVVLQASDLTDEEFAEIKANSVPGVVRRAPRFKPFFWTGSFVGILAGLIIGFWLTEPGEIKRSVSIGVTVVFTTMIVLLITAGIILFLDSRSVKQAEAAKKVIG